MSQVRSRILTAYSPGDLEEEIDKELNNEKPENLIDIKYQTIYITDEKRIFYSALIIYLIDL